MRDTLGNKLINRITVIGIWLPVSEPYITLLKKSIQKALCRAQYQVMLLSSGPIDI